MDSGNEQRLPDEVVKLLEHIRTKGYSIGSRLSPEPVLAQESGLSLHQLRTGLGLLEVLGVVSRRRGAGTYLQEQNLQLLVTKAALNLAFEDEMRGQAGVDLIREARAAVEGAAAVLACLRATKEDLNAIHVSIKELEVLALQADGRREPTDDDLDRWLDQDARFHQRILQACHNKVVELLGQLILTTFAVRPPIAVCHGKIAQRIITEHHSIFACIERAATSEHKTLEGAYPAFEAMYKHVCVTKESGLGFDASYRPEASK